MGGLLVPGAGRHLSREPFLCDPDLLGGRRRFHGGRADQSDLPGLWHRTLRVPTPLSSRTLRFLTGQRAARRREIGTQWRRLPAARQALLTLAHLRCGDTYAQLAAGFGIATVYRYVREAVEALSALAPPLAEVMRTIRTKAFVILDGTLLPIDRIAADTPYYSGKHKRHGMNVQVLTDPFGRLLWASPALPGSTHDLTAARQHGMIEALAGAGLKCWADSDDG